MTCSERKDILRVRVRMGASFAGVLLRQVGKGETALDTENAEEINKRNIERKDKSQL